MVNHRPVNSGVGRASLRVTMGALPLAFAVVCAGGAVADPAQPGVTQPGTATPAQPASPQAQPGVTSAPPAAPPAQAIAPPSSPQVQQDQAAPATDYGVYRSVPRARYTAPVNPGQLHAPVAVRQVAPILAPPGTIRIGDFIAPAPKWIPENVRRQVNTTASTTEAQIDTYARSVGVRAGRADRIAGGIGQGAATGFVVGAVPGVLAAAPEGALDGAVLGFLLSIPTLLIAAPVFVPAGIVLGGLAGAVVGGTIGGTILAVPGAVIGGAASVLLPEGPAPEIMVVAGWRIGIC